MKLTKKNVRTSAAGFFKKTFFTALAIIAILATKAQSDSASFYQQKGDADKDAKKYKLAYENYQHALMFDSTKTDVYRSAAQCALEMRRYDDARKNFEKVLLKNSSDKVAIENITDIYFATRKWNDAINWAQKAQQQGIGKKNNYIIAKSYYELENYGKAIEFLELAYKDDSKNAEVPYVAGRCFIEMSNYKKAAGCYEQALALDSSRTNWMYEAGLTYFAIPDDKKAVYWFEKAAAGGYKRTNDYLENIGNAYINSGEFDKGVVTLEELIQRKPQDLEVLYIVGEAYYKAKKYKMAIDTWDRILKQDDKNARSLYMIGMAYQKNGEDAKGKILCDKAIAMDPSLSSLKQEKKMSM
jgi:tetratricopeptide (TPR) repeat protein